MYSEKNTNKCTTWGGVLLNRKGIIPVFVVTLTILIILISMGYAALNQNLNISGEAFLRAKDNIRISRIELSDAKDEGYETYSPEYSKRTTKMYTTLPKDTSSVTYTVKVTNLTGIKYKVDSIEVNNTNSNVSCTPSIEVNSILEDGVTEFTVTANYENKVSQDTNLNVCDINYEFSPLDATPPTLTVQLVKDNGNTKIIKIVAEDDIEGSGLSQENVYKYYLSASNAALTGGEWKDYTNNIEFEIEGDFEVKYLWVYPVKDKAGNINDNKTNINKAYLIKTYAFVDNSPTLYNVIAKEALTNGVAKLYTGEHNDTYNGSGTRKIFHFYGADNSKGTEVLTKNNMIFAGFCWQMIRTTDTGGVKLIYNGVPKEVDGKNVCTNSGLATTIGRPAFASGYDSPAYAGYMYNTVYQDKSRYMTTEEKILDGTYQLDINYWYADSISYDSSSEKYSLVNPYKVSSTDDYSSLKGKYTFENSEQTYQASTVNYIGEVLNTNYLKIILLDGHMLDYYNSTYTYGTGYTKNDDGTYTINNPTNILRLDYYENYSDLSGKYVCKNATNNTCSNIWYVTAADNKSFKWLTPTNEYMYANTFSYSNGEYTLDSASSVMIWNVSNTSEKTKLNNAHYTCFNKTGKCQTIYNINYLDSNNLMYYIELKNGKSVSDALNEMLYADDVNKTNSTIKNEIDTWYANNMANYTQYLEDTVFCNDRNIADYGGWDSNGGKINVGVLIFKTGQDDGNEYISNTDIYCSNITDRFSVGNSKAKLTYPVGMITVNEMDLLGNDNARKSGIYQWLMSPEIFNYTYIGYIRHRLLGTAGEMQYSAQSTRNLEFGARPSVSLAPGTKYSKGTGSTTDPYIVDLASPTITYETLTDGEREKAVKIIASDDSELASDNKYKYYLSTSDAMLSGGEWKDYTPGELVTLTGENETKYLWVYPIMDNAQNINDGKTDINTPYVLATLSFKDKFYLYNILQKEYASGSGLTKLYSGQHSDTYNETGAENIYYFYGADSTASQNIANKNNLLFAGFCWQMIRTTDTGGVKLIYNGVPKEVDDKKVCTNSDAEQIIGTSKYNEDSYQKPMYAGYMYGTDVEDFATNANNSIIKTYIENWYAANMTHYTKYLEDTVFCNDRNVIRTKRSEIWWTNTSQTDAVTNLYCTNVTDRFSISNSSAKLTYPVGMISLPEINILGNTTLTKTSNYWTISPDYYWEDSSSVLIREVSKNYGPDSNETSSETGVRPVISISSSVEYSSGTGSATDPYIVDLESPTITYETLTDGEREKTVKIIINDASELASDNKYKYYLSTNDTTLAGGEWKDYTPGEIITLTGENETRYLWIYPVKDIVGNISDGKTSISIPYKITSYNFISTYTLTVELNGGTINGSTENQTYSMKYGATREIANPTKSGYVFVGWTVSGEESSINKTTFTMGRANATITANWTSTNPIYTYTGESEFIDDGDGNWRIKFLTSGTLTFSSLGASNGVDIFLVGGGGGGSSRGAGAGGGYTLTVKGILIKPNLSNEIMVGKGGAYQSAGNESSALGYKAAGGGAGGGSANGANGGSGGGAKGPNNDYGPDGGRGGTNGENGKEAEDGSYDGGCGQIKCPGPNGETGNTREFGENTGDLYAAGGGGGAAKDNRWGKNGTVTTLANSGAAGRGYSAGQDGIVIIRNHR